MAEKIKKVLVTDQISEEGIAALRSCALVDVKNKLTPQELLNIIGDYDALMVRSQTKVTPDIIEAGKSRSSPGRVGIDNADVKPPPAGVMVVTPHWQHRFRRRAA
jgi:D-3-phosphoglycerate dehydrogenase